MIIGIIFLFFLISVLVEYIAKKLLQKHDRSQEYYEARSMSMVRSQMNSSTPLKKEHVMTISRNNDLCIFLLRASAIRLIFSLLACVAVIVLFIQYIINH